MTGIDDMIGCAEQSLGTSGRPNAITRWYASRNGDYFLTAAWCNQSITYWANHSGNADAVCFGRDYAYTVWHAQRFRTEGEWHVDIAGIRRGDIVFFDWGGTNSIGAIDHIGIVTGVRGRVVYTIEGNTSDGCRRRARYASDIVGYGRPAYGSGAAHAATTASTSHGSTTVLVDAAPAGAPVLKQGSGGALVRQLQRCLNTVQGAGLDADGDFGPKTKGAVQAFQRKGGLLVDDEYGMKTAGALAVARKQHG
ncbi:MAG TPA: peptidoglycan-binding protein [Kineosporiaceae bacterium]|nr:peptidoglycan-binding protein [Kineosporiaceae bacterium]